MPYSTASPCILQAPFSKKFYFFNGNPHKIAAFSPLFLLEIPACFLRRHQVSYRRRNAREDLAMKLCTAPKKKAPAVGISVFIDIVFIDR